MFSNTRKNCLISVYVENYKHHTNPLTKANNPGTEYFDNIKRQT